MKESLFLRACGNWPEWAILTLLASIAIIYSVGAAALPTPWDWVWRVAWPVGLWKAAGL